MSARLAVNGGRPVRTKPFPQWPIPDPESARAVAQVVESGHWFRGEGTTVDEFERRLSELHEGRSALCVTSGTTALDTALRALDIGPGDEVIVPAYTFIATAMAVLYVGAVPVFVDVDPMTHLLDINAAKAAITDRTRAIMPVHLAGRPCDMDAVGTLAVAHGLAVIEDAAQAFGAEWRGRKVGVIGDAGAFSFQNSKNISAGDGGALVTRDDEIADRAYSLANVGRVRDGAWYGHPRLGYNLRMTEMQGALLLRQLDLHPERQAIRARNAATLGKLIDEISGVQAAPPDPNITAHGLHLVLLRIACATGRKDAFVRALNAEGIPAGGAYPEGLHRNQALIAAATKRDPHYRPARCPNVDAVAADTIALGHALLLADEEAMHDIATALAKVISEEHEW